MARRRHNDWQERLRDAAARRAAQAVPATPAGNGELRGTTATRDFRIISIKSNGLRDISTGGSAHTSKRKPLEIRSADVRAAERFEERADAPSRMVRAYQERMPAKVSLPEPMRAPGISARVVDVEAVKAMARHGVTFKTGRVEVGEKPTDEGRSCRQENRPTNTTGDGSGRPFIPWCQRGKK